MKGSGAISDRDLLVEIGTEDRDRTGTGLVSPRDFELNTDTETIERYLHESEEYHNDWEEQDECRISIVSLSTQWFCHSSATVIAP